MIHIDILYVWSMSIRSSGSIYSFISEAVFTCSLVLIAPSCSVTCIHMKLGRALLLLPSTRGLMPSLAREQKDCILPIQVAGSGWAAQVARPTRPTQTCRADFLRCSLLSSTLRLIWQGWAQKTLSFEHQRHKALQRRTDRTNEILQWCTSPLFLGGILVVARAKPRHAVICDILWLRWKSLKDSWPALVTAHDGKRAALGSNTHLEPNSRT